MSRGPFRISTLRCPEVGLGIPDLTSGHLDRVACRCPEVGLGIPDLTSGRLDRVGCWCPEVGLGLSF